MSAVHKLQRFLKEETQENIENNSTFVYFLFAKSLNCFLRFYDFRKAHKTTSKNEKRPTMTKLKDRAGCEKSIVEDPHTGREIWRMTNYNAHDIHSYYDQWAWSPDGSKIAFTSIEPDDVVYEKIKPASGCLFIMDADGSNLQCVASNADCSLHTGCFPIWADDETIIYHGSGHTCIVNIKSGHIQEIEGVWGRALSPCGSKLACQDVNKQGAVVLVNLQDFSQKEIVSSEDLFEIMLDTFNRAEKMPDFDPAYTAEDVSVANIKYQPNGSHLMLRFGFPGEYMKSIFVFKEDGTRLKRINLITPHFNHHSWHPDGEHILYNDLNAIGKRHLYYLADKEGLHREPLYKEPLGGHPILNPAGTEIVDFAPDGYIIHLDVKSGEVTKLASYTANTHQGLHAHPCWSRDGSKVIYHSDHTGTSQIYVIPLY